VVFHSHLFYFNIYSSDNSFVYKRIDQLTDKMSDSDEWFDILRDIKSRVFIYSRKKVTESINCEQLAAASAGVDLEQPPVPQISGPGPQQELE